MRNRSFTPWIVAGFTFVFTLSINDSIAQAKVTSALIKPDTTEILSPSQDTLKYEFSSMRLSDEKHAKSGNLAMLYSAILPGLGQVYAHRYYTIPLIWGFGYYFTSSAIKANNQYMDWRGKYAESVRLDTINHTGDAYTLSVREFYHNQRDEFIFYLALTYFLNIIDAYVGATLYDFNVSDDLGGNAKVRFRIPLR
ncbi:MAG: DUF5683 domain-containing protein [Bacteroidota bacterium]|jgi:hypothetical protein